MEPMGQDAVGMKDLNASELCLLFVVSCDSLLLWLNVHAMKYTILTILIVLFCGIKYIHIAVQPQLPFTSRTFSSFQRETLYPPSSLFASWPAAGNHYSFFSLYEFDCSKYPI